MLLTLMNFVCRALFVSLSPSVLVNGSIESESICYNRSGKLLDGINLSVRQHRFLMANNIHIHFYRFRSTVSNSVVCFALPPLSDTVIRYVKFLRWISQQCVHHPRQLFHTWNLCTTETFDPHHKRAHLKYVLRTRRNAKNKGNHGE